MQRNRRSVINAALGTGLCALVPGFPSAQGDPRNARPQEGDRLVYADGERKGTPAASCGITVTGGAPTATVGTASRVS